MEPEVAKRLCFEDVSMHSPNAAFTRFEAQRCRAQPSVEQLRRCANPRVCPAHAVLSPCRDNSLTHD